MHTIHSTLQANLASAKSLHPPWVVGRQRTGTQRSTECASQKDPIMFNIISASLAAVQAATSAALGKHPHPDFADEERYLAESRDMADLERRMRDLDRRSSAALPSADFLAMYPAGSGR